MYGDIISNDPSNPCTAHFVEGRFVDDTYILKGVTRCTHTNNATWEWIGDIRKVKVSEIDNDSYVVIDHTHARNISGPYRTMT
jgi:hypothetical protein